MLFDGQPVPDHAVLKLQGTLKEAIDAFMQALDRRTLADISLAPKDIRKYLEHAG